MKRALCALLLAVGACADGTERSPADAPRIQPLTTPAGEGSGQPSLTVDERGRALLTWLESDDDGAVLRMSVLEDTTWSAPRTIVSGRAFIVNWADFPTAASLGDGRLAAHWLEREGNDTYAYGVRVSFSDDGGESWSAPVRPHTDSTETEHGFVSMLPAEGGFVQAVWLDGRNFATGREEMTLRTARVGVASLEDEAILDERICDCCQTDAAQTARGAVVVYRDRSPEEIRDIAIVRRIDGRWTEPRVVHPDGWHIDGCPVNGPAAAARGDLVAVVWFTAARDTAKVLLAFSRDAGATFAAPIRIDDGDPAGHVDVALVDDETAVVSWIEENGGGAEVRLRRVSPDDGAEGVTRVAAVPSSRATGFPRLVVTGATLVIAWADAEAGVVRTARAVGPRRE